MKLKFTFLLLVVALKAISQSSGMNNALKLLIEETKSGNYKCNILVKGDIILLKNNEGKFDYTYHYGFGDIASISITVKNIKPLLASRIISYAEHLPATKKPLADSMIYRNRIKGAKVWTSPLPQAYNGEGVLMGIIDTGIDFNHPDFKDAQGNTRILNLWEQTPVSGGLPPLPYNYGIEWNSAQINNNLCTHSDVASFGHGTYVSGIAAGNGLATGRFEGVASKSDLVVVAYDFNKSGPVFADAVNYIFSKATALGRACVINASLGDYYGSHDGTDLETKLVENILKGNTGRSLVAAAGNAGHVKFHAKTNVSANDTVFTWLSGGNNINYWCYGDTTQVSGLQMRVAVNRSNYTLGGSGNFQNFNYALNSVKEDTIFNANGNRLGIYKTSVSKNPYGVCELYYEIRPDTAGLLWRIETTGSGLHHAWNFDFVSSGLPASTQYPPIINYVLPDSLYTLVSSFQCSDEVITVGNYVNLKSYYDVRDTLIVSSTPGGILVGTSSRGPTRDNRLKPDVTATGHGVISCMALGLQANLLANAPQVVAQGSMHLISGGTSASAPVVAGTAALYLQRYPNATHRQVRDAVRLCAYRDANTGSNLPDYNWGFGKLDAKATLYCVEGVYNAFTERSPGKLNAMPNPFEDVTTICTAITGKYDITVYNATGQLFIEDSFTGDKYQIHSSGLPHDYFGLILVKLSGEGITEVIKLLKQH